MIDEFSDDDSGWAKFSDDRRFRFRLARSVTDIGRAWIANGRKNRIGAVDVAALRVVFLMLNPSTADAFKLDPTVTRCLEFARRWGGDLLEVVNLFALRSPHPADLKKCAAGYRGDDAANDASILDACLGAHLVVAAWGNDGALGGRDLIVRAQLRDVASYGDYGVTLHVLGDQRPTHPLARGKHRVSYERALQVWAA